MKPSLQNHPILKLLQKCKTLTALKQIHSQMITTGLILHTYPLSRILLISSSTTSISYAQKIFSQIKNPTIFLYNILISCLAVKGQIQEAFSLYAQVLCNDNDSFCLVKPNDYTYPSLFKACGAQCWLQPGKALHAHVLKFLDPPYDQFVQASLLNFYSSCRKTGVARLVFDRISEPDLAAWNSILSAYSRNSNQNFDANASDFDNRTSELLEVLHLFKQLQESCIGPNEVTLVALVSACADLGALCQGIWAHGYLVRRGLRLNGFLGSALITLYSNCGCLEFAHQLFGELPERDTFCYNAMIRGLAVHGHGHEALDLFEKMRLQGLAPDDVTLLAVMCACSHVGLVDQGCKYFHSLKRDYGIEPKLEHYGCLVDILGRAGRVDEAEEMIRAMPMTPNASLWRSLLGAARVHGNLQVGEVALKHLIQLEPETSGHYVLLSNIYAGLNRYDDVKNTRKFMKEHGVSKTPGISILNLDVHGEMHEFSSGDRTHPKAKEIYMKLEDMNNRLQEHGHKPRTIEVLFDIEEEEKEDHLSYHSERLAIAFALIECPPKSPIRIIKNLRVCGDCHDITKLISRIYGREIIVRDRTRFHHFRNGMCSCLDYW